MTKLIISFKGSVVAEHELTEGKTVIGRRSSCDVHVDSLAVSGRHAMITTSSGISTIEDLKSTNGTFVDDHQITRHRLANGEVIQIGKHCISFVDASAAVSAEIDDCEKTMVIGAGQAPQIQSTLDAQLKVPVTANQKIPTAARPAPAQPTATPNQTGKLQILNGPNTGKTFNLTKSLTNLGKAGQHAAVISRRAGNYQLAHMDGPTLPTVNGTTIGEDAFKLSDGDIIEIGKIKMQFFYS